MSKTCGECKHHKEKCYCQKFGCYAGKSDFCDEFEPKQMSTNGDKIRQMSNEELAAVFLNQGKFPPICDDVPETQCISCRKCWLAWLNSPADCVKQNGNYDTQADLCKAGKTESEVEDE